MIIHTHTYMDTKKKLNDLYSLHLIQVTGRGIEVYGLIGKSSFLFFFFFVYCTVKISLETSE